eukprot:6262973-Alexandrium_andersonii.AAC.1
MNDWCKATNVRRAQSRGQAGRARQASLDAVAQWRCSVLANGERGAERAWRAIEDAFEATPDVREALAESERAGGQAVMARIVDGEGVGRAAPRMLAAGLLWLGRARYAVYEGLEGAWPGEKFNRNAQQLAMDGVGPKGLAAFVAQARPAHDGGAPATGAEPRYVATSRSAVLAATNRSSSAAASACRRMRPWKSSARVGRAGPWP